MQAGDTPVKLLGNPLNFSRTPVTYRHAPPSCGADSDRILGAEDPFSKA
jgi:crotonobetainyl-CoA:carnitine CoA-transferase CaiB-like acyl-CoA transferase